MTEETKEKEEKEEKEEIEKTQEELDAEAEAGEDASIKKEAEEKAAGNSGEEEEDETLTETERLETEISDLKERNTSLDATIRGMEKKFDKYGEVLKAAGMLDELDEDQQKQAEDAERARKVYLSNMWEMMTVNPKFENLEQINTPHNKQIIISLYADNLIAEDGSLDRSTAELAVKQAVDELPNPHKFFYEQITKLEKEGKEEKEEKKKVGKKTPELTKAPGSVSNMGGGNRGEGTYTMSKLDDMSDEELAKADIPEDILVKWKSESLPK